MTKKKSSSLIMSRVSVMWIIAAGMIISYAALLWDTEIDASMIYLGHAPFYLAGFIGLLFWARMLPKEVVVGWVGFPVYIVTGALVLFAPPRGCSPYGGCDIVTIIPESADPFLLWVHGLLPLVITAVLVAYLLRLQPRKK